MEAIKRFLKGEEGVTAIEYALIAAGIAIAIVVIVFAVGQQINISVSMYCRLLTWWW